MQKTIWQKVWTAAFCGLLAMAVNGGVAPASATTLTFDPVDGAFAEGEQYTVQVVVDDVADLLGASLVVEFDPAVVMPLAVTAGGMLDDAGCGYFFDWINPDGFTNTVAVDLAFLGCTHTGGGALAQITFVGTGFGTSPLTLQDVDLRDGQNAPIAVDVAPGSVTYQPAVYLGFNPESSLTDEEGQAEVCISLSGIDDFLGLSLEFQFDPAVITPVSVSAGAAIEGAGCGYYLDWINSDTFTSTVAVDLALLGCSPAMDGDVICLVFQGVESGESPLEWLEAEVRDSLNAPVPVILSGGSVLYNSAVDTQPSTLGALKAVYR